MVPISSADACTMLFEPARPSNRSAAHPCCRPNETQQPYKFSVKRVLIPRKSPGFGSEYFAQNHGKSCKPLRPLVERRGSLPWPGRHSTLRSHLGEDGGSMMEYRTLGQSGVKVSVLCLGTMN